MRIYASTFCQKRHEVTFSLQSASVLTLLSLIGSSVCTVLG